MSKEERERDNEVEAQIDWRKVRSTKMGGMFIHISTKRLNMKKGQTRRQSGGSSSHHHGTGIGETHLWTETSSSSTSCQGMYVCMYDVCVGVCMYTSSFSTHYDLS